MHMCSQPCCLHMSSGPLPPSSPAPHLPLTCPSPAPHLHPSPNRCIHPFHATTSPEVTDDDTMSDARRDEETGLRVSFRQRKLEATRSAYEEQVGG
jgi:hypothetical protein